MPMDKPTATMRKYFFIFLIVVCQLFQGQTLNFTVTSLTGGYTLTCIKPSLTFSITANTSNSILCIWTSSQNGTLSGNPIVINNPDNYTVTVQDLVAIQTNTQSLIIYQDTVVPKAIGGTIITLTCPFLHIDSYTCNFSPSFPTSTLNYTFHWDNMLGGVLTPTNVSQVTVELPGTYSCFVTNSINGCTTVATFTLNCILGIHENSANSNSIKLFPNPFKNKLNLQIENFDATFKNSLRIKDVIGKTVFETSLNSATSNFDLSHLSNNIYFIEIYDNDKISYRNKFIKRE